MKYFFPILMATAILFGLGLTLTPYIANWLLPVQASSYQQAKPEDARQAVADWFGVKTEQIKQAKALRKRTETGNTSWIMFEADRESVVQFIINARLNQDALDQTALQTVWLEKAPKVDWWDPASLKRETYFVGKTDKRTLKLIYNDTLSTGYLLIDTLETPNDKTKNSF